MAVAAESLDTYPLELTTTEALGTCSKDCSMGMLRLQFLLPCGTSLGIAVAHVCGHIPAQDSVLI